MGASGAFTLRRAGRMWGLSRTLRAILAIATVLIVSAGNCQPGGGGGGVTIPTSDATPPEITLGAGQPGGNQAAVSGGGSPQGMTLISKTGSLNLTATGKDQESGIQEVNIWVNRVRISCDGGGTCTQAGPGLLGAPEFQSASPPKNPGDQVSASSILAQALDLTMRIPQGTPSPGGSLTVRLLFFAEPINYLGGKTRTPTLTATWSE